MLFYNYKIKLRHDSGVICIITVATSIKEAVNAVLASEHAPEGAILNIKQTELKKLNNETRKRKSRL